MPTEKQKQAVVKIIENHGNISKSMREVGYTDATAKNPCNLTDSKGYIEAAKPVVNQLKKARQHAIDKLKGKIDDASYSDLTRSIDIYTKNIQLLSGEDTEKLNIDQSVKIEFV